jgi:hypothetical protein
MRASSRWRQPRLLQMLPILRPLLVPPPLPPPPLQRGPLAHLLLPLPLADDRTCCAQMRVSARAWRGVVSCGTIPLGASGSQPLFASFLLLCGTALVHTRRGAACYSSSLRPRHPLCRARRRFRFDRFKGVSPFSLSLSAADLWVVSEACAWRFGSMLRAFCHHAQAPETPRLHCRAAVPCSAGPSSVRMRSWSRRRCGLRASWRCGVAFTLRLWCPGWLKPALETLELLRG